MYQCFLNKRFVSQVLFVEAAVWIGCPPVVNAQETGSGTMGVSYGEWKRKMPPKLVSL